MYGVPEDLEIPSLVGDRLDHITTYEYQVAFTFDRGTTLTVQSEVDVVAHDGHLIARWDQTGKWSSVRFQECLGVTVEGFTVPNRNELRIQLHEGWVLRLYDNSTQYESFHIHPLDRHF
jgi:hypothetical protein